MARISNIDDLTEQAQCLDISLPTQNDLSVLARPTLVGSLTAPNVLAIHPMEGADGTLDGAPGELTLRRYDRFAAGGAGLLWAEAIAVTPEARANPRQLWLHDATSDAMRSMVDRIFKVASAPAGPNHRPLLVAQLTHSGRYSRPVDKPTPIIAQHCPQRDKAANIPDDLPVATDDYLDRLPDMFTTAAQLAFAAGFDAVDIKACHGYLLHELLGARTREGKYGGEFENRVRLYLDVIDAVRAELPAGKMIATRLNASDHIAAPHGWGTGASDNEIDLAEVFQLLDLLDARDVKLINITAGNPYFNPFCNRPFDTPSSGRPASPEPPLVGVARLLGLVRDCQAHLPHVPMVATGLTWLGGAMPQVAAGLIAQGHCQFAGVGRLAFAYPDFARDLLQTGELDPKKVCLTCSKCTQLMRDHQPTGCPVRDPDIYAPLYREGRDRMKQGASK
jgi:2,4-dienoyl-CoA reductase-like NADH-dependent reductase (Old Yellow Enzyme family)